MFIAFWIFRFAIAVLIVRAFVRLASRYDKSKVLVSVLALILFAIGFVIGTMLLTAAQKSYPESSVVAASLKWSGIVSGLIFTVAFYYTLKRNWNR